VAHIYIAWIHPFGDGNGRTARLAEYGILFGSGVPSPAAHLLSDHYNRTRSQYYRELDRASKSGGDLLPFIRYAVQGFLDGLREQIDRVRREQLDVAWENYVHSQFTQNKPTPTQKRRRDLVLALANFEVIPVSVIEDEIPAVLAREYRGAGDRMMGRDLNVLASMGLVTRRYGQVMPNKHLISAFLPDRVEA